MVPFWFIRKHYKGGIGENEPIKLQRFEVIRHK
jgi:hypothetical protein